MAHIMEFVPRLDSTRIGSFKGVHIDNENKCFDMKKILRRMRIELTTTSVHTAKSDRLTGRMKRDLMDEMQALMNEAVLP